MLLVKVIARKNINRKIIKNDKLIIYEASGKSHDCLSIDSHKDKS